MRRARAFTCALAGAVLLTALVPASASAAKGSCTSAAQVGSDVWKYAGPVITEVLGKASPQTATVAQILKAIDKGIRAWNKLAGNSWAKIGPRRLDFNKTLSGTLIGVTERVFVSPMIAFRPVTIDFYKLDGKNTAKVVVCTVEKGRKPKAIASFTVDDKTRTGKVRSVTVKYALNKLVKVVIHGKKFGTRSLKYKLQAKHVGL